MFCNYIWRDAKTGIERYIGWSSNLERPCRHIKNSHNVQLSRMIQKRIREGYDPQPEIMICKCQSENYAKLLECCLIEKYGREDLGKGTLFNHTDGGEGIPGRKAPAEERAARSAFTSERWANNPEEKEKQAVITSKSWEDPDIRARRLAGMAKPESRLKISQTHSGKIISAVHCQQISDFQKNRPKSAETCKNMSIAAFNRAPPSEETCRKISESHTGLKASDEARAKQTAFRTGCKWWNDGIRTAFSKIHPGEGWNLGRLPMKGIGTKGKTWWHNGSTVTVSEVRPGEGWKPGQGKPGATQGSKWWHNGPKTARSAECPGEGWKLGRK